MKPYLLMKGGKALALLSLSVLLSACEYSLEVPEDQERKTLFEIDHSRQNPGIKGYTSCGIGAEEPVEDTSDGINTKEMLQIPLPDLEADEKLLSRLEKFRPLAEKFLAQLSKAKSDGVLLDLRADRKKSGFREDYVLEKEDDFALPVIILWDEASVLRAEKIKTELSSLPEISTRKIEQKNLNINHEKNTQ
ncbi:hypothetical protein [Pedobacter nyackensis]|uniref:hypothetical protein n=1 Tax=Pedobacter nyackensis TaxID=475255 RepID=UPI002931D4C8|nr:hypothetical protein [Pedobacter nyackensis]